MTAAEAERIVRKVLQDRLGEPCLLAGIPCQCEGCRDLRAYLAALDFLFAELARKDEALRHLVGVAERAYGKALFEYRCGQPDARPEECWAEFEALGDAAAALGEQP